MSLMQSAKRWLSRFDFEYAMWQAFFLFVDPKRVCRTVGYHYQTKGKYARDDPAFFLLLSVAITVASCSFGIAFFSDTPLLMLRIIAWTIFVDLVATGLVTATLFWWATNKFLRDRSANDKERVEWMYCLDIHFNGWCVLFVYVYLLCYILLPVLIVPHSFVSTLLANGIYAAGITHYTYVSFIGYSSLPFLQRTNVMLAPVGIVVVCLTLLTFLLRFNVVIFVMNLRYST